MTVAPPCYFNTGCCSFPDGDVTGLEIADRQIRLVRWPGNLRELDQADGSVDVDNRILAAEPLEDILSAVCDRPPGPARVEEQAIRPRDSARTSGSTSGARSLASPRARPRTRGTAAGGAAGGT